MKKCLAVLLSVLLLLTAVGVSAEEAAFAETSRRQTDATKVEVSITLPSGAQLVEVLIGGEPCQVTGSGSTYTISLVGVPTGLYTGINYVYELGGTSHTSSVKGTPIATEGYLDVTLTASFDANGRLTVKAVDENDTPVPSYELSLVLEGMPESGKTNDNGVYTSTFRVSEGKNATYEGLNTGYKDLPLIYNAAAKQTITRITPTTTVTTTAAEGEETTTVGTEETTTAAEGETTTTVQQADATTASKPSTTATVKGDSTTALADGKIATNAMTDTALLEAFGMTRSEFLGKTRLLLSEADYTALVGRTGNVPLLSVRTSTAGISAAMVQAALTNVSEFSGYAEDQRQFLTFDLSLLMMSRTGKDVPVTALPDGILYTVQLPVPSNMKNCAAYAITVMDGDALMTPQKVEVKNGMFELTVNSLEAYTLIGFGETDEDGAGGMSRYLIVLLIVGILLIAGAAVLLYFFVFRKPEEAAPIEEDVQPELPQDNDTDIFSGRTDVENVWEPEDN